jgi:hypothetical protein
MWVGRREDVIPITKVLQQYFGENRSTTTAIIYGSVNDEI